MAKKFGYQKRCMLSLPTKEASYGAGVTVSAANYHLMNGYVLEAKPDDKLDSDLEAVNGYEFMTERDIIEYRTSFGYEQPRGTPNAIAGLGKLAFGAATATQDAALTAYKHYITKVAAGTDLPTIGMVVDPANRQDTYKGVGAGSFKLSGEKEGIIKVAADLITSGELTESASTWQSKVTEVLMRFADMEVYIHQNPDPATDWIAAAALSQTTDNISSGHTLTSIGSRVRSFSFEHNNNPDLIANAGGGGYLQGIDFGRRSASLHLSLDYVDETERDYYTAGDDLSLEFNCKSSTLVAAGGAFYYGFILRFSQVRPKQRPEPKGGPGDAYTLDLDFDVMNDGTNTEYDLTVYTAIAAYLA